MSLGIKLQCFYCLGKKGKAVQSVSRKDTKLVSGHLRGMLCIQIQLKDLNFVLQSLIVKLASYKNSTEPISEMSDLCCRGNVRISDFTVFVPLLTGEGSQLR